MATMPRTIRDSRLWKWLSYMRNKYGRSPNAVLLMVGLALFVDTVCMGAITPGLPDLLQSKLKMDDYTNGILYGCFGIGVIFGAVTAGIISDRYLSRRAPMVVGLFGLAVTAMLFAFSNSFWKLVLARIAQGAASGITWTIGLAMVADVVPEDRLGTAMGTASIGLTLGNLSGPLFGGLLYEAGGTRAIAIFIAGLAAVDLLFRLWIPNTVCSKQSLIIDDKGSIKANNVGNLKTLKLEAGSDIIVCDTASPSPKDKPDVVAIPERVVVLDGQDSIIERHSTTPSRESSPAASSSTGTSVYSKYNSEEEDKCRPQSVPDTRNSQPSHTSLTIKYHSSTQPDSYREKPPTLSSIKAQQVTFWELLKQWPILLCALGIFVNYGCNGSLETVIPIQLQHKYKLNPLQIGLCFFSLVIPSIIASPIIGWATDNPKILRCFGPVGHFAFIVLGNLLSGLLYGLLAVTHNIAGVLVLLGFIGVTTAMGLVPITVAMAFHLKKMGCETDYGKLYAIYNICYSIAATSVPASTTAILHKTSFVVTVIILGCILVAGSLFILGSVLFVAKIRDRDRGGGRVE